VNGSEPEAVVAVVEPGPVPLVPLFTEPQVCWEYPWQVDELARADAGTMSASAVMIPTKAEKRFMNPFVRRGSPRAFTKWYIKLTTARKN